MGDCGVCGIPASHMEVVCTGYAVPRCDGHRGAPAYQAEARLEAAESRCKGLEEALKEIASYGDGVRHSDLLETNLAEVVDTARTALEKKGAPK